MKIDNKKLINKLTHQDFITERDIFSPSEAIRTIKARIMKAIDESAYVKDGEYYRWRNSKGGCPHCWSFSNQQIQTNAVVYDYICKYCGEKKRDIKYKTSQATH